MANSPKDTPVIPVQVKLSALWASLMSLFIYNDYFKLYRPGEIVNIATGNMGPLGHADDMILLGVSVLLAIPALMIAISVLLPARVSCWANIAVAFAYTVIECLTFIGAYPAYKLMVAFEIAVTLTVIGLAINYLKPAR